MKRVLVIGASSGLGKAITINLINDGFRVWGVARRLNLLKQLKTSLSKPAKFDFSSLDISKHNSWQLLINRMNSKKFIPEVVIFNAAILKNDLMENLQPQITQEVMETNFFSVIYGVSKFIGYINPPAQFVVISSSSSLKGSGVEGIGYAASKAAISVAFESLYQKYRQKGLLFKTIYFGPIRTGMNPTKKDYFFTMSEDLAAEKVKMALKKPGPLFYYPGYLLLALRIIKLLPPHLYFKVLDLIDKQHFSNMKKQEKI